MLVYLFVFIAGMLFYGVIVPLVDLMIEYAEANKEVFVSNHSVIIAKNNLVIQKAQSENGQSSLATIGFECPSEDECEDDEYEEDDCADMNRKVGF